MNRELVIQKMNYCQIILALQGINDENLFEALEICTDAFKEKAERTVEKTGFFEKLKNFCHGFVTTVEQTQ